MVSPPFGFQFVDAAKRFTCEQLLALKNEAWLGESEQRVFAEDLVARPAVEAVGIYLNPERDVERYNRTVRYEGLAHYLFDSIEEVQDYATRWLWPYNYERPNMAIGGITPKQKLALAA